MLYFQQTGEALAAAATQITNTLAVVQQALGEMERDALDMFEQRRQLEVDTQRLKREREQYEREKSLVSRLNSTNNDIIELNIGGVHLSTTRKTLCAMPDSMLAVWFSGRFPLVTDTNGRILLDRDHRWFSYVLDFLRNGCEGMNPPTDHKINFHVRREFDFFCIPWPYEGGSLVKALASGYTEHVFSGHVGKVVSVDASSDGNRLVSGGDDCMVRVWDTETGKTLFAMKDHTQIITTVSISEDIIVTGSSDRTVRVWDANSGTIRHVLNHVGPVAAVGIGTNMIGGCSGYPGNPGTLLVWEKAGGRLIRRFDEVTCPAKRVSFYGKFVVGMAANEVHLLDVTTGRVQMRLEGHTMRVKSATVSEGTIISCAYDSDILQAEYIVWDPPTHRQFFKIMAKKYVQSFAFVSGCIFIGGGEKGVFAVEIGDDGESIQLWQEGGNGGKGGFVMDLAICGRNSVCMAGKDGSVRLWKKRETGFYRPKRCISP